MRLRDRPLLVDGVDRQLYVERPSLENAIERPLLSGRNVLLLGEAGAGKTTLMRRAAGHLRDREHPVAWVNAAPADDALAFLELVDDALEEAGAPEGEKAERLDTPAGLLVAARHLRRPQPATIVVDGLLDPEIGFDVFGRLRDELWEVGHTWLVSARPRDSGALRTPPADAFWSTVVEIPPLDLTEATQLLQRGLDEDEFRRVNQGRPLAGVFPRALIRAAENRLVDDTESGAAVDGAELERRASELGASEAMATAELLGLGRPVSAHDPELLERLGWSRPYAQRILSRLESAGLVRAIPERGRERAGRPRKLYEPTQGI